MESKYKEAIDCYDKAIELDPKHIDSWYQKGMIIFGLLLQDGHYIVKVNTKKPSNVVRMPSNIFQITH